MKRWAIVLAMAAISAGCAAPAPDNGSTSTSMSASAPGAVDCTQAESASDKAVCAYPDLLALDTRLAQLYQQAVSDGGSDATALESEQRGWATGRDDCWNVPDPHQCILESYQTRLVELQIKGAEVPATVEYRCGDGSPPVSAVFYNDIDPPAMVLTVGADKAILIQQIMGSGIRYQREGAEYTEHQGDIAIDFHGSKLVCTAAK